MSGPPAEARSVAVAGDMTPCPRLIWRVYELWREPIKSEALANGRFGAHSETQIGRRAMSEKYQQETHASQQLVAYSITSSARASSVGEISKPSAFAVLRLTISSTWLAAGRGGRPASRHAKSRRQSRRRAGIGPGNLRYRTSILPLRCIPARQTLWEV